MDIRGIVFVVGAGVAAMVIRTLLEKKFARPKVVAFVGDPANDKKLVVQGWTEQELRKILADFGTMYKDRLPAQFSCEIRALDLGTIMVTFPADIPAEEFSFLVNYVVYPMNFDLNGRSPRVTGSATLSSDFPVPDASIAGKGALFYVPVNDDQHDLVYVRVGNDATFENSFAAEQWKRVDDPRLPPELEPLIQNSGVASDT